MIFTTEQVGRIRSGQQTAGLTKQTEHIHQGAAIRLRRRSEHGAKEVSHYREDGERLVLMLTITEVKDFTLDQLGLDEARACGWRTVTALKEEWKRVHPRITAVKFVRFELGDTRDIPRFLRAGAPGPLICPHCKRGLADRQGVCKCGRSRPVGQSNDRGYTTRRHLAMLDAGEALSEADTERYSRINAQKFIARTLRREHLLATRSMAERLGALERVAGQVDIRSELRIIEQRIRRAERRSVEA